MSGTIPLSMTQQFDVYGQPLAGGQLYLIQAGTVSTPQNPYQDAGLTLVMPNPIVLDAAGRIPQFFLADGFIKIRLVDVNGITQLASDGVLVIGPSAGGGGGGGTVDPTTILQTGDIKTRYDTAVVAGFVRANGRSIGPSTSSATELADTSANALFNFLWNKDATLAVLPSRGGTSAADWAAGNKTIALPDWRGYSLAGLDDMGNTQANRLSSSANGFGTSPIVLGAAGGGENLTLVAAQIPSITASSLGVGVTIGVGSFGIPVPNSVASTAPVPTSGAPLAPTTATGWSFPTQLFGSTAGITTTSNNTGGGLHRTLGPRKLLTIYMKL